MVRDLGHTARGKHAPEVCYTFLQKIVSESTYRALGTPLPVSELLATFPLQWREGVSGKRPVVGYGKCPSSSQGVGAPVHPPLIGGVVTDEDLVR